MVEYVKGIICFANARLTIEERNLLSAAYKNTTGALRGSWRAIVALEQKEGPRTGRRHQSLMRRERLKIESEITAACRDILDVLEQHIIPAASLGEERVFYCKM